MDFIVFLRFDSKLNRKPASVSCTVKENIGIEDLPFRDERSLKCGINGRTVKREQVFDELPRK